MDIGKESSVQKDQFQTYPMKWNYISYKDWTIIGLKEKKILESYFESQTERRIQAAVN